MILINYLEQLKSIKICIPFIGYPLHKNEKHQPFFIIGSGRSGNTLVRRILNEHSELYIPPETYVMGESIRLYKRYRNIGWAHLVKLIYGTYEFHPEFNTFHMGNLSSLYFQVSAYRKEERSLSNIFHSFYEHYKTTHGLTGKRWGDKTPLNTLYVNEIFQVFPDAKFIHIIRNPYDAIHSYVKSGIYKNYSDAAQRWKKSVEIASAFGKKNPGSYYEIEYEQLVENPELHIKNVCEFLAIAYEENMLNMSERSDNLGDVDTLEHHANVLKPISKDNIGKGVRSLSKEDILIINEVLEKSQSNDVRERISQ